MSSPAWEKRKLKSSARERKKNKDKICMGYYSFLFSPLTIHSYKTCSPQPWIIYHFFLHLEKSVERELGVNAWGLCWYLFTNMIDGHALDLVKVELFKASYSFPNRLCPQGWALWMPHLALQSHSVINLKLLTKVSPQYICLEVGTVRVHGDIKMNLYLGCILEYSGELFKHADAQNPIPD